MLHVLDLSDNNIKYIRKLDNVHKLKYLYLNNNKLSGRIKIPEFGFEKVHLYLNNNQITSIHGRHEEVVEIHLRNNNITELSDPMEYMCKFSTMDVTGNKI